MASYTEIERKYDAGQHLRTPALHELPGVATVAQPVEHELHATYFDTDDLDLAHARVTLRRRTGGDDEGWHLKLPRDADHREEVRQPLGDPPDNEVPAPLLDRVRGLVGGHRLAPVASIRTRRVVRRLLDEHGVVLAEFCDDHVSAERQRPDPGELSWREWEVELVDGAVDLLDAAEQQVLAAGAAPAAGPSKLARVLGTTSDAAQPAVVGRGSTVGEVLLAYVSAMVDRLVEHDPLVRANAEDAVHQMRVSCRRLRSVLATYRPILDRRVTEPLRAELSWLGGELGLARDSEVMRERLDALVEQQPDALVLGPVLQRVDSELARRHRDGLRQAHEALDSRRYLAALDALRSFLVSPPFADGADDSAAKVLPSLLQRDWKRLRKRIRAADDATEADQRDRALHEVRKAAKRLRYAADSTIPVLGDRAAQVSAMAERMQDVLGEHQDTAVARELLRGMGVRAQLADENAFTFGRLHALEEARAVELRQEYAEVLTDLPPKKLARWLRS